MSQWKFLKENDIVDVIAPGYPSLPHEVEGSRKFLLRWKLQPRIPKGMIKPHFLHANEDQERFAFLKAAIESKDSHVIWCTRGGYGSNRLVPMLAKLKKPKEPKLLIGLSDITSLHVFLTQEWGWKTVHGPILDRMGRNVTLPKHEKELHRLLFGDDKEITFSKIKPLNEAAKKLKNLNSKIVGGNLTVLHSTLATPWQIDAKNSLLFIEDIGERGYRIDRMLEQFRQAGVFKKCDGIILGDFTGGVEPDTGKDNFNLVWKRWAGDLDIPLFKGLESGHGVIQRPVPFNTKCHLEQKAGKVMLTVSSGGRK
jgi:muramoyltetrapeptide carboxypeptidase